MKPLIVNLITSALPGVAVVGTFATASFSVDPQDNRLINYQMLDAIYQEQGVPEDLLPAEVAQNAAEDGNAPVMILPSQHQYYQFVASFIGSAVDTGTPFSLDIAVSTYQSKPAGNEYLKMIEENEANLHAFMLEPMLAMTEEALRDSTARQEMLEKVKEALNDALKSYNLEQLIDQVVITNIAIG